MISTNFSQFVEAYFLVVAGSIRSMYIHVYVLHFSTDMPVSWGWYCEMILKRYFSHNIHVKAVRNE